MRDDTPNAPSDDGSPRVDLADALDDAAIGIIRFDRRLRVQTANVAAHRALARRPDSLIGRSIIETFLDHRLEEAIRAASKGSTHARSFRSTGGLSLVVRASPAAHGGVWVIIEDVTELEHLRRIRTEFIENLSHELRTPLANVRLLMELLMVELAGIDVPSKVRERVATMDVETGHMVQMINELLDLSRMEQVSATVRQDAVALPPLVGAVEQRLRTFAQRQDINIRVMVSEDLPAVRGDEEALERLLMNLMHNAIKFSPSGGTVSVTAAEHPDGAVVSIADEGSGIAKADQDRIFERFYKVDRARERGLGGTGLGLAIARHIAELHGGRLWVESAEGRGAKFSFSVPLA